MKLQIRHWFRKIPRFYVSDFFELLTEKLSTKFTNIEFDLVCDKTYQKYGYGGIYSPMNYTIINPENGKNIVISFFDNWKTHFMKHMGWDPDRMVKFFYAAGFNYIDYYSFAQSRNLSLDIKNIYSPFYYNTYEAGNDKLISELYDKRKKGEYVNQLFFRGGMWAFRRLMVDKIQDASIRIIDKNQKGCGLNYSQYLEDMTNYSCSLSLPGATEICNRDIESFAVGVPVLRPLIATQYPDPLIPNYHYISFYADCKYWAGTPEYLSYEDFSKHLVRYWKVIKNNKEYLDFVATNAREWYLRNCTIEKNTDYVLSKINPTELI
jgi:hypothetical protein